MDWIEFSLLVEQALFIYLPFLRLQASGGEHKAVTERESCATGAGSTLVSRFGLRLPEKRK